MISHETMNTFQFKLVHLPQNDLPLQDSTPKVFEGEGDVACVAYLLSCRRYLLLLLYEANTTSIFKFIEMVRLLARRRREIWLL